MMNSAMHSEMTTNTSESFTAGRRLPLETAAQRSIEEGCSYAFYFRFIRFDSRNGVLTVRGSLPSFYLKQVLISHLQHLDGVRRIDDRVDVVSSTGLSSVRN